MTKTKPFDILRRQIDADPVRRQRVEEMKRAMCDVSALARLRESRGATQVELAGALGVSQSNVSRIEHGDNPYLSTLREYVEALGGRLQLTAVFPDQTILLTGADEESSPEGQRAVVSVGRSGAGSGGDAGAVGSPTSGDVGKEK